MTRYVEILAVQRPFPFNADENGRTMWSVNFQALAIAPVDSWEENLISLLGSSLATLGSDTFIGPDASIPGGSGPFINVIDTGGRAPDHTHNDNISERLSAQIVVRALDYRVGRTRALAIWRVLDGQRDILV